MTYEEIHKEFTDLFDKVRKVVAEKHGVEPFAVPSGGKKELSMFLLKKYPNLSVDEQTLKYYEAGGYGGFKNRRRYGRGTYENKLKKFKPYIEEFISVYLSGEKSPGNRKGIYSLDGTYWNVYFFNKFLDINFGERCNLGKAIINFSAEIDSLEYVLKFNSGFLKE